MRGKAMPTAPYHHFRGEWLLAVACDEGPGRRRGILERPARALAARGPTYWNRAALASRDVPMAGSTKSSVLDESCEGGLGSLGDGWPRVLVRNLPALPGEALLELGVAKHPDQSRRQGCG